MLFDAVLAMLKSDNRGLQNVKYKHHINCDNKVCQLKHKLFFYSTLIHNLAQHSKRRCVEPAPLISQVLHAIRE